MKRRRSVRRGLDRRVGLCRCTPLRAPGQSLKDRQRARRDSLHDTSVAEDLSLGGFMARIVIKPNS